MENAASQKWPEGSVRFASNLTRVLDISRQKFFKIRNIFFSMKFHARLSAGTAAPPTTD
jgi:hypothetical protein